MEMRLSDEGMIAHKETEGESDLSGEPREWVLIYIPLHLASQLPYWIGLPLYNYEVDGWLVLPHIEALVGFTEAI